MLKKQSAGLLLLVCTFALAQSTAPADHSIAVQAGHLFDGTEKLAAIAELERVKFVMKGGQIFKNELK